MAKKYYAIKKGKRIGIVDSWTECQKLVLHYPGAEYKSFSSKAEAKKYLKNNKSKASSLPEDNYAFVDGSYNDNKKIYGYGGFLMAGGKKYILQGCGADKSLLKIRNIAGELAGAKAAINKAISLGLKEITILYDYMGIEKWASKEWTANTDGTINYQRFCEDKSKEINIRFLKVKAHSGIDGNEEADRLAKNSVGL